MPAGAVRNGGIARVLDEEKRPGRCLPEHNIEVTRLIANRVNSSDENVLLPASRFARLAFLRAML